GTDARPASFGLPVSLLEKCCSGAREHILENIALAPPPRGGERRESRLASILIIPLKRHRTVTGMVYLENDLMGGAFRNDQVQFLSILAGQATIAMENALAFEKLNAEREYSSNIIQNAPSLILGFDAAGILTFINPASEKITGYRKEEVIGRDALELFFPGDEYEQVERLFEAFAKSEVADYEMTLTRKDGERKHIVWSSFTKRGAHNRI
ncbi:MAG: PAS domain S-box protein, partial [Desulfobacterales bacterium]|nr:PAS domain S-box protein [Desulfobacterales bacterium]